MQFDYLATVCAVVQEGSFSAAARRLHLSQPAVSHHVGAVERALGVRLVDRSRSPVVLTAVGRRLYPQIEASLRAFRRAEEIARRSTEGPDELRLAAMYTFGEHVLPRLVGDFRRRYPSLRLAASVGDRRQVLRAVLDGAADLGVSFGVPGDPEPPAALRIVPLWVERLHLVVAPGHPWADAAADLPVERLGDSDFILLDAETATRSLIEAAIDVSRLHVVMEVGTNQAVRASVKAGLGAGFVSELALDADLRSVPIEGLQLTRSLIALLPRQPPPGRIVREFLDLVRASGPVAGG